MQLEHLTGDVYACLQEDKGLGWSNSGLISRGGGLVVDTFWDLAHTRRLIEQYARVWAEPTRRVLNTHHNGDHCWGNQLFGGAEIIGHRRCAEALANDSPEGLQAIVESADSDNPVLAYIAGLLGDWDFRGVEITPPTTLFDDRLSLDLDGVRVDLIHVGPAHTEGDVIAHLPAERVVFAGDVLFRLCTPISWEGTFDRWCRALDFIVDLDPQVIVPGHGPLCGAEGPREMKAYLEYIRDESRVSFEAGLDRLAAARRIDLGPYASWTEPERIVFQVERAYRELRGEPHDAPIDSTTLFADMYAYREGGA